MYNKEQVRSQLIQYFKAVGSGQNIVQAIKQALFLNEKFNPLLLFQMLSQGKQKITGNDWKKYLIKRNIHFVQNQIRYFFRHNHLGQQISLNQFLQSLIPYNADVIRQFKVKYLDSLEIDNLDPQIDFIFAELMKSWVDFIRNLIQIRNQISQNVTRKQIQHLVKEDLVLYSKPRQARKFHQAFQQRDFKISFNQLRKFLQLWQSQKHLIPQFCLLNVKRHIKCEDPFRKITYNNRKNRKQRQRSGSQSRSGSISASRSKSKPKQNNTQKKRQKPISADKKRYSQNPNFNIENQVQEKYLNYIPNRSHRNQKYENFKQSLLNQFQQSKVLVNKQYQKRVYQEDSLDKPENGKINNLKNEQIGSHKPENGKINNLKNEQIGSQKRGIQNPLNNQIFHSGIKKSEREKQSQRKEKQAFSEHRNEENKFGQHFLVKIFQQIIFKQQRLQKLRKQLAKSSDFNIINLFKLIDNNNKGYLSSQSIEKYFSSTLPFDQLVDFYGRQKGKLRFHEFSMIFRPLSKQLNQMLDSRTQHRVPNPFKKQTLRLIAQIIQLQNQMHINLHNLRNKIKVQKINPKNLFEFVDLNKIGYISSQSIKKLLEENNINCEPKDMKCLMKLFNKKIDEKISEKEFLHFINF